MSFELVNFLVDKQNLIAFCREEQLVNFKT